MSQLKHSSVSHRCRPGSGPCPNRPNRHEQQSTTLNAPRPRARYAVFDSPLGRRHGGCCNTRSLTGRTAGWEACVWRWINSVGAAAPVAVVEDPKAGTEMGNARFASRGTSLILDVMVRTSAPIASPCFTYRLISCTVAGARKMRCRNVFLVAIDQGREYIFLSASGLNHVSFDGNPDVSS